MSKKKVRTLIAIGGHENKVDTSAILEEIARRIGSGKLVITTVATRDPDSLFEECRRALREHGIKQPAHLKLESRHDACDEDKARMLDNAKGVFFIGGDQLKITSQVGDTLVFKRIADIYNEGGLIVVASSGASAMCETMIVSSEGEESKVGSALQQASGLGLIEGAVIDQHFSERGRIKRLLGAIAQNPRNVGMGIDENTAVIIENGNSFRVVGSGAVCVIDCSETTETNIAEGAEGKSMSIYDVKLHLLGEGEHFDLQARRPAAAREALRPRVTAV